MKIKYKSLFVVLLFIFFCSTSRLKADEYIDSLKTLIIRFEHDNLTDTVLNTRLELIKYVKDSDYDLFLELAGQNIVMAQKYKKNWALIDIYMEIGEVLITKGIFGEALNNLNKAKILAENDDYKPYEGWINIAIGNAYNRMFNYSKGIEFYNSALDVFVETKNTDGIGLAATNLGTNYSMLNNLEKAEYFFKMGLDYREKLGNPVELGYTRMYYNEFQIRQGNYGRAESDMKALLVLLENDNVLNNKKNQFLEGMILQAEIFTFIAKCQKHSGNFENEFLYLGKATEIYQSIDNDLYLAINYNQIGNRYLEIGEYHKALDYSNSAIKVAKKSVILTEQANSLKLKADAYTILGKYQDALEFFKAYKIINDSIYNSSVIQAISNVDVLMKTKEKEKDILILSLKLEQDRKLRILMMIVAISFILMIFVYSIFLFHRYNREKRIGLILKGKNQQISEQANTLEKLNQKLLLLNMSKDRFHSIIAHDLRSPVASFCNMIELLHETYDSLSDKDRKTFIEIGFKSADRTLKLLDNLLAWSRIQGGYLNIRKEDFFIDDAIWEIVDTLNDMANLKNITLEVFNVEHLKVFADKEMITTVIRNLGTNAIKFTNRGQQIQIGMKKSDEILEVWVLDHGIGIPKNKLDELFEIDSQMQRNGTNNEPGTGLGLQLCYEFIKLHSGKITVESEEGKGSRFAFVIPYK